MATQQVETSDWRGGAGAGSNHLLSGGDAPLCPPPVMTLLLVDLMEYVLRGGSDRTLRPRTSPLRAAGAPPGVSGRDGGAGGRGAGREATQRKQQTRQ